MKYLSLFLSSLCLLSLIHSSLSQTVFNYDGSGTDWTGTCANGKAQSPVAVSVPDTVCDLTQLLNFYIAPGAKTFSVIDTGETIRATATISELFATAATGLFTGYQLAQFHFHAPSEHTINGKRYDMEMHLVHTITADFSARGQTTQADAVFSIMFEADENADANMFINAMNFASVGTTSSNLTIDVSALLGDQLPSPLTYYTYEGSLTTPPCSEIVNWYIVSEPMKLTPAQLAVFTNKYAGNTTFADGNGNDRLLHPLNGRTIKRGGFSCADEATKDHKPVHVSRGAMAGIVIGTFFGGLVLMLAVCLLTRRSANKGVKQQAKYQLTAQTMKNLVPHSERIDTEG